MTTINVLNIDLQLLPERAIYIEEIKYLLVSDVHLGKSETFQTFGVPISSQVNRETLDRLQSLCLNLNPERLIILGDLFHSRFALTEDVLNDWSKFLKETSVQTTLILGNHDRRLARVLQEKEMTMNCVTDPIQVDRLILSHEPCSQPQSLNICGHVHPCVRLKTKLDNLRLPCFYLERSQHQLILPSFGEFTGSYEVKLKAGTAAYVVVDNTVVPFE
ncbi:MAG TPA: ligase-associated DNA damage response endonuclease PdeM [Crinalium sp.]